MRSRILLRVAIGLALVLLAYAACGFLLVPWLLQRHAPGYLQDRLGRAVSVGEFRANPFLLKVEAKDVSVAGDSGHPVLAMRDVVADAGPSGLLHGTVTLQQLRIDGLEAHVVVRADGSVNVQELVQHWRRTAGPSKGNAWSVAVDRIRVPAARVVVTDRTGQPAAEASIAPIDLQVDNLSTGGQGQAHHQLTATLPDGGSLAWKGELALAPSLQASGSVQLNGLRAQALWPFARNHLALSDLKATLDGSGHYAYDTHGGLQLSNLAVNLSGVGMTRAGAETPMLEARHITVHADAADLAQHTVRGGALVVSTGSVRVERSSKGVLNWANLGLGDATATTGTLAPASTGGAPAQPWTIDAPHVHLQDLDLSYDDQAAQAPLELKASGMSAQGHVVFTAGATTGLVATDLDAGARKVVLRAPAAQVASLQLDATTLKQGRFDLARQDLGANLLQIDGGQVLLSPATAGGAATRRADASAAAAGAWTVSLQKLQVAQLGGRLQAGAHGGAPPLTVGAVDGSLQLKLQVGGAHTQVLASALDAQLKDVALAMPGKVRPVHVASAKVTHGHLDLAARQVGAAKVQLSGAAPLVLGTQGLLLPVLATAAGPAPPARHAQAQSAWHYAVDQLQVPSLELQLVDDSAQPPLRLGATLRGGAQHVASGKRTSFDVGLALAQGGKLKATGTADIGRRSAKGTLQADAVALRPLQPLLARYAALDLRSGTLSGSFDVAYGGRQPGLLAKGSASINGLALVEAGSGDRLLAVKRLDVQGATLDTAGRRVVVDQATVASPEARIVVSEDRSVNLTQVFGGGSAHGSGGSEPHAGGPAPFQVAVHRVLLRDGQVDFADHSLVLPFSTKVKDLQGTVVDISSQPLHRASVQAKGTIAPYGSASIDGTLAPFDPTAFTNLQVKFSNVQVPPLSPYTATFAGRKVQSGRLWLDLDYHVEKGEVLGKNSIRLSNFSLGERVDAPNALDIPLNLVVALLRDGNGQIHLNVPLTGDVGDPHFSVASAVKQALGNVLRRIVSAPFRALAGLFGDKGESLAAIGFRPGSAQLQPAQLEKLDALGHALRERPQLRVVIGAPYDPQADAKVLQRQHARLALAHAVGRDLAPGEDPGPIAYDDPATRRALERLVRERAGDAAVDQLRQQLAGQPEHQVAAALFDRLVATQDLPDDAARILAVDRARQITQYLQQHGTDRSRLQTGRLASEKAAKDGEVTARLELAADDAAH